MYNTFDESSQYSSGVGFLLMCLSIYRLVSMHKSPTAIISIVNAIGIVILMFIPFLLLTSQIASSNKLYFLLCGNYYCSLQVDVIVVGVVI
jgi:hypothetical protein